MFKRLQKNNRIENVRLEENTKHFIDGFKKLVEQNNQPTINRLIKFMANSVQGELISKCLYNDRNYAEYTRYIVYSLVLNLSFEEFHECSIKFNVEETPIISCIWNYTRMFDSLEYIGKCNKNPFDGDAHSGNINACLINPLGLVIVDNGNHSVNSAIVHNEGEIIANVTVDISPVLEKYKFNGKDYVDIITNEKINNNFQIKEFKQNLEEEIGARYKRTKRDTLDQYLAAMKECNSKLANIIKDGGYLCYILPDYPVESDDTKDSRRQIIEKVVEDCKQKGFHEEKEIHRYIPGTKRSNNMKWASLKNEKIWIFKRVKHEI